MKKGLLLLLLAGGCGSPVENCPDAPDRDCCTNNAQCLDYYGADLPYCEAANAPNGGVCSECLRDDHCGGGEVCDIVADFGVCI